MTSRSRKMIYTVGLRAGYDEALITQPVVTKKGRCPGYPGGSVWEDRELAESYLLGRGLSEFAVYGVLADWEAETTRSDAGDWNDLLIDAQIVRLDDGDYT